MVITDFSLPSIINAASGAAFVIVGAFCVAQSRQSRRALLLGVTAMALGIGLVGSNLILSDGLAIVYIGLDFVTACGAVLLAAEFARGLGAGPRRLLFALAVVLAVAYISVLSADLMQTDFTGSQSLMYWLSAFLSAPALALALLGAACALRFPTLPREAAGERRALAYLTLAFGLFAFVWLGVDGARDWNGMGIVFAAACCTIPVWLAGTKGMDSHLARNVLLALAGAGVAGLLVRPLIDVTDAQGLPGGVSEDYGLPGVARFAGVVFLVLAIVRHDLLRVPLPRLLIKRGPLAAAALGTLFIVAQIMQNFLSAEYGLLMGRVIAGMVLLAASPLQKVFESLGDGGSPKGEAAVRRPRAGRKQEEAYRGAVRLAWKDRHFDPSEELALAVVADGMGLSAARATAIRHEVEREKKAA